MENRIKECQLDLFADRTSAATMRANPLRLWFAAFAYVLLCALRRIGLAFTQFARASCGNIRRTLLKIGALVKISVRRVHVAMASACPYQHEFALAHAVLRRAGAGTPRPRPRKAAYLPHQRCSRAVWGNCVQNPADQVSPATSACPDTPITCG